MNFERDEIETQKNGIIYMIWHMIATKKIIILWHQIMKSCEVMFMQNQQKKSQSGRLSGNSLKKNNLI